MGRVLIEGSDDEVTLAMPKSRIFTHGEPSSRTVRKRLSGLEIAVEDAGRVRLVQRAGGLGQVERHLGPAQRPALLEDPAEVLAAEQLHHQEGHPGELVDPCVERPRDVVALDAARDPRLLGETGAEPLIREEVRQHHLEGAASGRLLVDDLVHRSHAALLDASDNPIAPLKERPGLKNELT